MEPVSDNVTYEGALRSDLLIHTLNSWRFFLLFTLPPLAWCLFVASPGILRVMIALLSGIVWFSCWRLWLDAGYFSLIVADNNAQAGKALAFIWQRDRLHDLAFTERQQGALKQCRRTLYWLAFLWGSWLVLLYIR